MGCGIFFGFCFLIRGSGLADGIITKRNRLASQLAVFKVIFCGSYHPKGYVRFGRQQSARLREHERIHIRLLSV